jgi:hypothetical protein
MNLWSEYEGRTIAEAYPLGQLIQPEGRSALFTTSNGTGVPSVIRLTESLNDEDEMLESWRRVSELNNEHILTIRKYGLTQFESTPLTFALMETSDGDLAEILRERPLTVAETREVAVSVVAALKALHGSNLVHEHVEAGNVLAVGDVIKLRSDCARECVLDREHPTPEGCAELKKRDVHGLGLLLLQALTLERSWTPGIKVAAPFDTLIPRAIDGSWGLADIDAALTPPVVKPLVPESVLAAAPIPATAAAVDAAVVRPAPHVRRIESDVEPAPKSMLFWAGCAAAALFVILLGWYFTHRSDTPTVTATEAAPVVTPAASAPAAGAKIPTIDDAPVAKGDAASSGDAPVATARTQAGWHVVAFTYNHEDQARGKVASVRAQHPGLSAEVFSPNGRAPFFVALGGGMSEREAVVLRERARRDGLPRDTFIRRYGSK